MTKEYQSQDEVSSYAPTRKDCFDMMIKEKTATKTYTDEFGKEVRPMESSYDYEGFEVEIGPSTPEEVTLYKELINGTKRIQQIDNDIIFKMVFEEANTYFKGDKSVDDAVNVIQSRVETYVNENR